MGFREGRFDNSSSIGLRYDGRVLPSITREDNDFSTERLRCAHQVTKSSVETVYVLVSHHWDLIPNNHRRSYEELANWVLSSCRAYGGAENWNRYTELAAIPEDAVATHTLPSARKPARMPLRVKVFPVPPGASI